jgi:CBS domain-containing membrane protein
MGIMRHFLRNLLKNSAFYFGGDQPHISIVECLRAVFGAFMGLFFVFAIAKFLGERSGIDEWLMASLGASALLIFVLPQSPMAQPWAVIAGNTLSALVGILCFHLLGDLLITLPLAVALSILCMLILRCLHPPAAAVSLIVVLGHIGHYRYAFFPVMVDSALLILAGFVYSNLTGKAYPNKPHRTSK